jgi:hypothetical protein
MENTGLLGMFPMPGPKSQHIVQTIERVAFLFDDSRLSVNGLSPGDLARKADRPKVMVHPLRSSLVFVD